MFPKISDLNRGFHGFAAKNCKTEFSKRKVFKARVMFVHERPLAKPCWVCIVEEWCKKNKKKHLPPQISQQAPAPPTSNKHHHHKFTTPMMIQAR